MVNLYNYHYPNHVLWLKYLIKTVEIGVIKLVTILSVVFEICGTVLGVTELKLYGRGGGAVRVTELVETFYLRGGMARFWVLGT